MKPHVKNYIDYYGYDLNCVICGAKAVDIHHIIPRSKFGTKTIKERDSLDNLIALCRECHIKAHAEILTKEQLKIAINNIKQW